MTAISRLSLFALGAAALFALAACDPMLTGSTGLGADSTAPTSGATSSGTTSGTAAGATLAELRIAPDGPMTGYRRDRFGDGWATQSDGCETRIDVLLDDGTHVSHHGCTVVTGRWVSLYDGVVVTSPHELDVDHIVPLANAWVTGARYWTSAQRVAFANDVHRELVAVTAHSNRSKGDEAPPGYEPSAKSDDCQYAERWITVKSAYHLTITSAEHDALASMLATCPS